MTTETQILTYKFRLKDKHSTELNRQARAVNTVWNYCNETQKKAAQDGRRWLSGYDFHKLTSGSSQMLDVHAHTIQRTCAIYAQSRQASKRPWLRWRGRRSLGWVPFNTGHVSFDGASFVFRGKKYFTMHLRPEMHSGIKIGAGSFNQDAKGNWYINVKIEAQCSEMARDESVGIDLGLCSLAALSSGRTIPALQFYRKSEEWLASAQRAKKTNKRIRRIHAKISNRRKDHLHKETTKIANQFGLIFVGNVSPKKIARSMFAKSSHDAAWGNFKNMLAYKAHLRAGRMIEVPEQYTSQTCSHCGTLPHERPAGIAGLGIREWTCGGCGAIHDRDVNAARNILRVGQHALVEGALK